MWMTHTRNASSPRSRTYSPVPEGSVMSVDGSRRTEKNESHRMRSVVNSTHALKTNLPQRAMYRIDHHFIRCDASFSVRHGSSTRITEPSRTGEHLTARASRFIKIHFIKCFASLRFFRCLLCSMKIHQMHHVSGVNFIMVHQLWC